MVAWRTRESEATERGQRIAAHLVVSEWTTFEALAIRVGRVVAYMILHDEDQGCWSLKSDVTKLLYCSAPSDTHFTAELHLGAATILSHGPHYLKHEVRLRNARERAALWRGPRESYCHCVESIIRRSTKALRPPRSCYCCNEWDASVVRG